jgi:hypothetical protein
MRFRALGLAIALAAVCAGCSRSGGDGRPAAASAATSAATPAPGAASTGKPSADGWLGQWDGPEGTFLRLSDGDDGRYEVTVRNLDGPRTFAGTAAGDGITFERDGVVERLGATDGPGTGMKWLAEKSECLVVRAGEGWCRR